ncbi:MAG: hypothetical protein VW867_10970, partial [Gammaproteobacteria bacterium]
QEEQAVPEEAAAPEEPASSADQELSAESQADPQTKAATPFPQEGKEESHTSETENPAGAAKAPADATPPRPARAANDPREVRRREREAALRAQGVTINNPVKDRQDTTEGSNSSST